MTETRGRELVRVALVGCGALAELYASPELLRLERSGAVRVTALVDTSEGRLGALGARFPGAARLKSIDGLDTGVASAALVCSPVRFHAEQSATLLERGISVLCEKPMARDTGECGRMCAAAAGSGARLAIGHLRRFAPALRLARSWIRSGRLGPVRSVTVEEGGPFEWPAATPSFFDKSVAGGGVFLDVGVHVLDILIWCLGEPSGIRYRDDARGGVEANCLAELEWEGGPSARIRLSRDWRTSGLTRIVCANGELRWRISAPDQLELVSEGLPLQVLRAAVPAPGDPRLPPRTAGAWSGAYGAQLAAFLSGDPDGVCATGGEGARAVAWVARAYSNRENWVQPWTGGVR
jgi:predicted dehydrogenase